MLAVRALGLEKKYGTKSILAGASADFPAGRLSCLIGRSGSGKSTLLKCLNGLVIPDSGSIEFGSIKIDPSQKNCMDEYAKTRRKSGMVFQNFQLFPHLTLLQNVAIAQEVVLKRSKAEANARAVAELERVQLGQHKEKYPSQLSGGQQQRGAIARALAMDPELLLYDEPTSALDIELVDEVLQIVASLSSQKLTQILVTHELPFVQRLADQVYFLDSGKIIESGTVKEIFQNPQSESLQIFLRKTLHMGMGHAPLHKNHSEVQDRK